MAARWATFDCYGTLIDWNGGIHRELARVFGEDRADELLERYHDLEPELEVVAGEIGSYKPAHAHWERFFAETGAERERHVHVGASLFHDIAPARELGLPSVWINRLGERADAEPTRELPDLSRLPETLDDLVAA